jgi:two-component system CheB/CheR fusion protein
MDDEFETVASDSNDKRSDFYIAGVGASAGGLEALEAMFKVMPTDTGIAFVIVQHLSPDFKSHMEQLLARHTTMPIHRVESGMQVEPNCIYLIPPKMEMAISNGKLLLTEKSAERTFSHPIDHFFRSLASDVGQYSIGVILSGTGSDGSRGIRDIHEAGGLVVVQDENTAKFDGMPINAQATRIVNLVLPPEGIADVLEKYVNQGLEPELLAEQQLQTSETGGVNRIFHLLHQRHGVNFSHYKATTVGRRIQRRINLLGVCSLEDYISELEVSPVELNDLYEDLLIGVTKFFRDPEAFQVLERTVIPRLFANLGNQPSLRMWIAGCASGEEVYSIAMLVDEAMRRTKVKVDIKIFATDVHQESLNVAARGVFPESALSEMSSDRRIRYFQHKRDGYHVNAELRQHIIFAPHNIIRDAPFTQMDLVSCRNLLIYLRPSAQKKALSLFHFALKSHGVLFLGPSETPGELMDEFTPLDKRWRIYVKRRDVKLPLEPPVQLEHSSDTLPRLAFTPSLSTNRRINDSLIHLYDTLLNRKMPPSILINEHYVILHVFGGAERYLHVRGGRPTNRILDAIDTNLKIPLAGALHHAVRTQDTVCYTGIQLKTPEGTEEAKLSVTPISIGTTKGLNLLIEIESGTVSDGADHPETTLDVREATTERISGLESELRFSQENLQATIEELETSNEELQATNEELVASTEELQSTNEELHSVNEELYTVNAEHQRRIDELAQANADMDNLLATTRVGVIFLDNELYIRRFTPEIARLFHLIPQDVGRPIDNFVHQLAYDSLMDDLRETLHSRREMEVQISDRQGTPFLLRMLPYRSGETIQGVVMTLIDVSSLRDAQAELEEANAAANRANQAKSAFLANISHELRTPMTAVLGFAEMLHQELADDKQREKITTIKRNGEYLLQLLNDILDLSKIEAGRLDVEQAAVGIQELIEDVKSLMSIRSNQEGVPLSFEWKTQVPDTITGDRVRIRQILVNLIGNALKFTDQGEVRVAIELKNHSKPPTLDIAITDTGIGMTAEQLSDLFKPFSQTSQITARQYGGTGLGLSISQRLAHAMNGSISVTSEFGQGSCFTLSLPVEPVELNALKRVDDEDTIDTLAENGDEEVKIPYRILLADDRRDVWRVAKFFLENAGASVTVAEDGRQAVEAAVVACNDSVPFDIILMDMQMPIMTGREAVAELRRRQFATPIIALTADAMEGEREACLEVGCDDYLSKPIDGPRLIRAIAYLVGH